MTFLGPVSVSCSSLQSRSLKKPIYALFKTRVMRSRAFISLPLWPQIPPFYNCHSGPDFSMCVPYQILSCNTSTVTVCWLMDLTGRFKSLSFVWDEAPQSLTTTPRALQYFFIYLYLLSYYNFELGTWKPLEFLFRLFEFWNLWTNFVLKSVPFNFSYIIFLYIILFTGILFSTLTLPLVLSSYWITYIHLQCCRGISLR